MQFCLEFSVSFIIFNANLLLSITIHVELFLYIYKKANDQYLPHKAYYLHKIAFLQYTMKIKLAHLQDYCINQFITL